MGIPSYFSHIIKNYANVLQKYNKMFKVDNLYIDSNSIIYDCMRDIEFNGNVIAFEKKLINNVCLKIEEYIENIQPYNNVYIAFDGVAPIAKLNQQRQRRYKTNYIKQYDNYGTDISSDENKNTSWNGASITPGTNFMTNLNNRVQVHFNIASNFNVKNIIVSGSNVPGEGEHKIFQYIRDNKNEHLNSRTVVYGLDADLIMLSVNHLEYCKQLYLFRETPDFIKTIDSSLDPNYLYVVNIPEFKNQLTYYLNNDTQPTTEQQVNRIHDYIFLCFMLGNDFLPHFPALNIRTNGMDLIMNVYRNTIGNTKENITNGKKIYWKNFRKVIKVLAENEELYLQNEQKNRDKLEKRNMRYNEDSSKYEKELLQIPIKERAVEKYINVFDTYWQERYYDMLFDIDITDEYRKQISFNYLEGLEWTFKYYTSGCPDWRWRYNYHYPPLLADLLKYIPYFETDMIIDTVENPVDEHVQLAYVLPHNSLDLLPNYLNKILNEKHKDWYKHDCEFEWSYCKYFWESHVKLEKIEIPVLENIILSVKAK